MFQESKLTPFPPGRDAEAATRWMRDNGVEVVHVGVFDTSGTLRQKRFPAGSAAAVLAGEWSFIDAIQNWDPSDGTYTSSASRHQPVVVDPDTARPFPFEDGAVSFVADFSGPTAEQSGRFQLGRMVDRCRRHGIDPVAGWEFELIVLDQSADALAATGFSRLEPAIAANRCWSALTPATESEVIADWTATLAAAEVPVHHTCSELGPGCLELALAHSPAMRSADDAALAKLYTKAFFARSGRTATFMAQLADDYPGLGGHPSLSFSRMKDGSPVLAGAEPGDLSPEAGYAIGGIVQLLPEFLVMATPTVNSFRRYAPGNWAPRTARWGIGNYTCGVRVVADRPDETRLELRIPGADTTPHLCLAMMLGEAVWGIENHVEPPAPVQAPDNARDLIDPDIGALPRTLSEAADRFATSKVAEELFGATFVGHLSESRLAEDAACRRFVSAQERARYLHHS